MLAIASITPHGHVLCVCVCTMQQQLIETKSKIEHLPRDFLKFKEKAQKLKQYSPPLSLQVKD